jgi:hypothetical protein
MDGGVAEAVPEPEGPSPRSTLAIATIIGVWKSHGRKYDEIGSCGARGASLRILRRRLVLQSIHDGIIDTGSLRFADALAIIAAV